MGEVLSSENVQIDAWATFMTFEVYDVLSKNVNICTDLSSANDDDATCPSSGSYYFSETIAIPSEVENFSSLLNLIGISVYAYDSDSGDKIGCFKASLNISSQSGSSSSSDVYNMSNAKITASMALVGATIFAVLFVRMNRRRTAVIDIDNNGLMDNNSTSKSC